MRSTRDRVLERSQIVPIDIEEAFAFFSDARNLEAITPRWLRFRIVKAPPSLERGSLITYRLRLLGAPIHWRTEIAVWQPPHGFTDVQLSGPYRRWEHEHRLRAVPGGTEIHDRVTYRLPFEPLAGLVAPVTVQPLLSAIFAHRNREIADRLRPRDGVARFPFRFDPAYERLARPFGVTPENAWVDVGENELEARYGPWRVRTPLSNVAAVDVTGPYSVLKTAGPARLALTDRGLTFGSNRNRGARISFHSPVTGIDRGGRIRHPELTVTVRDVEGLVEALGAH